MKICWQKNVFVRHLGDESIVCCPRTGGCTVMENVRPFLELIGETPREEYDIISKVAETLGVNESEVFKDAHVIYAELDSQRFVVREGRKAEIESESGGNVLENMITDIYSEDEGISPLSNFCTRHGILSELHLDLTDVCTERCLHCYVPQNQHNYLPYAFVEKILREFRIQNGLTVELTGGEAMLHPDFEWICRLCVELNLNFVVFSNMTLCDTKRVEFLKEVNPQFINVSLYSMDSAVHDAITRLPGSWQKTMDALLACEKAGVHCRIATPLLKENQTAFAALKRFATEHHMHLVPSCDIVSRADHSCTNLNHACSAEELENVLRSNLGIFDEGWDGKMPNVTDKTCSIGLVRLYLNAKGNFYPCDCMHGYVLGNVRDNTLEEIWRGEKLDYLRGLKNRDFGECARCERRPWCKVCPAANFNATGDLFTHHPNVCTLAGVVREVYGRQV